MLYPFLILFNQFHRLLLLIIMAYKVSSITGKKKKREINFVLGDGLVRNNLGLSFVKN